MISKLSERFRIFAERECEGSSLLYQQLSLDIANDPELLRLAAHSSPGQPVPNLFLGAVHYLLLCGMEHELANYYASIVSEPQRPSTVFPHYKRFCKQYESLIIPLLENKLVQTNEVRRCAYLYPSFNYIYHLTHQPLALIEIGTSAGLQLLWDQYRYHYPPHSGKYGNAQSTLEITTEMRGDKRPILLEHSPPVTSRIGVDLFINDLNDPEDYLWLRALIWPEHIERRTYFDNAASCLPDQNLQLIEGDGVALLPEIMANITRDSTLCIFHTHVANQFSHEHKIKLGNIIQTIGEQRDVFHLYNNMWDLDLHLDYYLQGKEHKQTLAQTDGHGRWFEWKGLE